MSMDVTRQPDGSTEIVAQRRDKWFIGLLTAVLVLVIGGGFKAIASGQSDQSKATQALSISMEGMSGQVKTMSDEMKRMRNATDQLGPMKVQVERNTSDIRDNTTAIRELRQVRKLQ